MMKRKRHREKEEGFFYLCFLGKADIGKMLLPAEGS